MDEAAKCKCGVNLLKTSNLDEMAHDCVSAYTPEP
jgi:hypothetical protein